MILAHQIHLVKTLRGQPEPNRICAGFVQFDPGHLWKNAAKSESRKLAVGLLHSARTGP